jgi:hypothetical protein
MVAKAAILGAFMFRGHVDTITHRKVEGWAANDAEPDRAIHASIYVDGRKVAQIICDRLRHDLEKMGLFGGGHHGFQYQFAEPLPDGRPTRVAVLFSETGRRLDRGEWILNWDGSAEVLAPDTLRDDEPAMMPAPRDPRSLFELLLWYTEGHRIFGMLGRLEFADPRPHHVHYSVFGRYPDRSKSLPSDNPYYPHDHLCELLMGDDFQANLVPRFADAYADKRRLIFVHVPKCAGTDLSNKLKSRYPWMDYNIMDPLWTTKDAMLLRLSRLALQLRFADSLYICGHAVLNYYLDHHMIRPDDQVFTVVRQPADIAISQLNYVLTRFSLDIERGEVGPDTAEWLSLIGHDGLPAEMSDDFVRTVVPLLLENPHIVTPNTLCRWLGGNGSDAQAAFNAMIRSDIEVVDVEHYQAWLEARWNIVSHSRDNASVSFVTLDELSHQQQDYIEQITQDDLKLHRVVVDALAKTGKSSIFAHELDRLG